MGSGPPTFCTIVSQRHLPDARVIAASVARHHPQARMIVAVVDLAGDAFDPAGEPFEVLTLDDLAVDGVERMAMRYDGLTLSWALTPALLSAALDRTGGPVVYIKRESLVTGELTPVLAALERDPIVMVAHLLDPLEGPDAIQRELTILLSGVYNIGLFAVAEHPEARRLLRWWSQRLRTGCRWDVAGGVHWEQRWIDLVPSLFEGVGIVRDPSVGVGHWNLDERAGVEPRFLRLSGHEVERPELVTKYKDLRVSDHADLLGEHFARFDAELLAAGWEAARDWPVAHEHFADGTPIPPLARELYGALTDDEAARRFGDPFAGAYLGWLREPIDETTPAVSRFWAAVHGRRPDLSERFGPLAGGDREGLRWWIREYGCAEYGVSGALAP